MNNREWLYSLDVADLADWFDAEHVDANDANAAKYMDNGECVHMCPNDSREKLEADARALQTRIWQAGANNDGISLSHIIELLNRQAAITEREAQKRHELFCETCERVNDEQLAELTAERDALADDLLTCNREREHYRELFSEALTLAAEIVNLQP